MRSARNLVLRGGVIRRLVIRLAAASSPADVRSALATALDDPSLQVLYRLETGYVDTDGHPVTLDDFAGRTLTPVASGALVHAPAPARLDAVVAAAAMALENVRLGFELRAQIQELEGSRARVIAAADAERRRLERNLHDGAQQRLVGIALQLRLLQSRVRGDAAAEQLAAAVAGELAASLQELRELARGLHPAALDRGLALALESLAARSPVPTSVVYDVSDRPPAPVELAAYFVASEALTNVAKYARAEQAQIRVSPRRGAVHIEITDDGVGGADARRGSGLRGLLDRVEALQGTLRVVSPAAGGTTIVASLPVA